MSKYRFEVFLLVFFFILTSIITFPLVFNFRSSIYGLSEEYVLKADVPYSTPVRNADAYGTLWELWWKKRAFLQKIPDSFSPLLGISGMKTDAGLFHMPIINAEARWLTIIFNEVFAYNLLIFLSFPLAGLAMYLLAFYLTKDKRAAALAGLIFAFAPLHHRYAFEWLGMAQWHWLPLYFLALIKLDEGKSVRWGLLAGLLFSVTFIENYYFGYFAIFFTLAFVFFRVVREGLAEKKFYYDSRRLKSYFLAFLTIGVLTLPVSLTFVRESRRLSMGEQSQIGGFVRDEWQRFALSARPWYFILPDVNHPLLGNFTRRFYDWISQKPPYFITKPFYPREHTLYLGLTTIFLSAIAVFEVLRSKKFENWDLKIENCIWLFLFLGIMMMIFSAPPYATVSLHKIYFPSYFLYRLFPMFRSYARFGVLVLLCFSILAAFGVKFVLGGLKSRSWRVLFLILVFGLIFFEFLDVPPFHNVEINTLPVYEWLAEQPGDFAILVYPEDNSNFDLLAQRVHGKRFLNPKGRTSPEIREVYGHFTEPQAIEKLHSWGVRYIIIRRDSSLGLEEAYKLIKSYKNPPAHLFEVP